MVKNELQEIEVLRVRVMSVSQVSYQVLQPPAEANGASSLASVIIAICGVLLAVIVFTDVVTTIYRLKWKHALVKPQNVFLFQRTKRLIF